jgi:hypothetical protein
MRITKKRLRQIIQEELRIINEQTDVPLRGDPGVVAYQNRPRSVKAADDRAAKALGDALSDAALDAVDDFRNTVLSNPEVVSGASLLAKGVGLGLVATANPVTTAAGMTIINASSWLDGWAALGYLNQEDYNAAAFSALGAKLKVNQATAEKFYRQVTRMRNELSKNPTIFWLVRKRAPAWAWIGASATLEATLQSAEAALESEEDRDAEHVKKFASFVKDLRENKKFLEQVEMAEAVQDFYHTQTGY